MRKLLLALAALAAVAIAVPLGFGSSHREAPNISLDPSADNTDTYAWTAKDAPGALTVAANWIPGEVPASGPNFHGFDDRARYYVHLDNTGDGRPDISYRFKFKTRIRNRESFLYAGPGTDNYGELNVIQQVRNVASDLFVQDAWGRGQPLCVHGWVYELSTGLVKDLEVSVSGPDEFARVAAFLLSPAASYVTGVNLLADGGMVSALP